ncbi:aminoglycoside 3-N-acetyltransferase [Fibrisoma montanum]|uniref:Aminoglycoside N(3)-acetyltransferase n=1 Tax=Fibrisoma montanum TaxID=2305895 RepID=A0A418MF06_9BACT|nr:aminoglycoside 3-N-acetyltransferase [Fibrisoma montanum]RIV25313.1 aminoglycoside 3-N-acetyltransferase [Fibrisoma montanum]
MLIVGDSPYWTRRLLSKHLQVLGLQPGDAVMVHAALRSAGPILGGPDTLIGALLDVLGPEGTLLCYVNWEQQYEDAIDETGRLPETLKADIPPFDPAASRASRDHGAFAEFVRTTPGAYRSRNPGASVAAIGARAAWFTADHPLDYGYGPGSPFDKLVVANGKVLMVGAPLDTISLLHHSEHLAQLPNKRIRRMEVPLRFGNHVEWRMIEEFDTVDPVVNELADDYFGTIVEEFLLTKGGQQGMIGSASSVLLSAPAVVSFAVQWLEQRYR